MWNLARFIMALALAVWPLVSHGQGTDSVQAVERAAAGKHCWGKGGARLGLRQHLVVQYNNTGAEHHARLGACWPLVESEGVLWERTHFETGVFDYLSPAFMHLGGYAELVPIAPLVLRVELSGVGYWPLPELDRAGYVPRSSYDDTFDNDDLGPELSEGALGWNTNFIAIPRLKIGLGAGVSLIGLSQFSVEYWDVGDAPFYVNLRRDALTAQKEWLLNNEGVFMVEWAVTPGLNLRAGGYDQWRMVLGNEYTHNQAGGILMVNWPDPEPGWHDISVFTRLGAYTDHDFREGEFTAIVGTFVNNPLVDF